MEIIDLLLAFFLGPFGIYRFYKKYTLSGIIWLCTLGIGGIGALIDLIFVILDKPLIFQK